MKYKDHGVRPTGPHSIIQLQTITTISIAKDVMGVVIQPIIVTKNYVAHAEASDIFRVNAQIRTIGEYIYTNMNIALNLN